MIASTVKKNVLISLKNTFFRRLVKIIFGNYPLHYIPNSQVTILEQYDRHVLKYIF